MNLVQLRELVPELGQVEPEYVPQLVDVVLDRATARVASPTRYVAAALRADVERWPVHHPAHGVQPRPLAPRSGHGAPTGPAVPMVPCTNPDHDGIYNPADCPQCRLEHRLAQPNADGPNAQLSAEQLEALPASLRRRIGA